MVRFLESDPRHHGVDLGDELAKLEWFSENPRAMADYIGRLKSPGRETGHEDDAQLRRPHKDPARQIDAVQSGHLYVRDQQVIVLDLGATRGGVAIGERAHLMAGPAQGAVPDNQFKYSLTHCLIFFN